MLGTRTQNRANPTATTLAVADIETDMTVAEAEAEAEGADGVRSAADSSPVHEMRVRVGALIAILVVAAALRLYRLGDDSLWDNEILSLRRATAPLSDVYELLRAGTHPPLYSQVLLRPWLTLGDSEFMQRLPSAVLGVSTVALTSLVGRRAFGWRVGLAAAALLAVLPLHVYYSREGRMYALLALLVTLWVFALLTAHRSNSVGAWSAYAVLGALILYTHYYAGLTVMAVVGATGAVYLVTEVGSKQRTRWLLSSGAIAVLFLPWLPTFLHQLRESSSNLPGRTIGERPDFVTEFFTAFVDVSPVLRVLILGALAVLSVFLVLAARRSAQARDAEMFPLAVMAGAVIGTILLAILISFAKPIIFVRYFVGILPLLCILLAAAAVKARPRLPGFAAYGALLVISGYCVVPVVTDSWRPDFGAVAERIAAEDSDGAVLLVVGPNQYDLGLSGLDHYDTTGIPVRFVDSADGGDGVADAIAGLDPDTTRVWLLQYRALGAIDVPGGLEVAFEEQYDSRFFERSFPMRLTLLEQAP